MVQVERCGRGEGEIAPILCSAELSRGPGERPGYHSRYGVLALEDTAGDLAPLIQLLKRDGIGVGCYLEHAVGGRVDDGPAGREMTFPQLLDYGSAGGGDVPQHPSADLFTERHEDFFRESPRIGGERTRCDQTHVLPMPYSGVFPRRPRSQSPGEGGG